MAAAVVALPVTAGGREFRVTVCKKTSKGETEVLAKWAPTVEVTR